MTGTKYGLEFVCMYPDFSFCRATAAPNFELARMKSHVQSLNVKSISSTIASLIKHTTKTLTVTSGQQQNIRCATHYVQGIC